MKFIHYLFLTSTIIFFSFLTGCSSSSETDVIDEVEVVVDVEEPASDIDVQFSLTAHESNVLMVNALVTTSEASDVSIVFESAETEAHETSQSIAQTSHNILVLGLRPQTSYQFTAIITNQSGEVTNSEPLTYTTPALPFSLPDIQLQTTSSNSYKGITFFAVSGADSRFIGVDEAGVPVWYLHQSNIPMLNNSPAIKYLGENRLMLLLNGEVWIIDMAGNILSSYDLPTYHHEATLLDNGNVMVLTNEYGDFGGNRLKGDRIQEYNQAGTLVWQWSSFEHLDTSRFPSNLSTRVLDDGSFDWSHSNALFEQADDGSILLSVRSQSWVINIDHQTGEINWILGNPQGNTNSSLDDKFLSLQTGSWTSSQHAPMQTANGDYLIYDNRNESELSGAENNSRAVKYHIDANTMVANQVWEFVVDKYTQALGDVDELANGNILITAGGPGSDENAHLIEVTANDPAEVVWSLHVNNQNIYRAERVSWDNLLSSSNTTSQITNTLAGSVYGLHDDGLSLINGTEVVWSLHVNNQNIYRAERVSWDNLLSSSNTTSQITNTLAGSVYGLHDDGLSLINGTEVLSIAAGTTNFAFAQSLAEGSNYNIQLVTVPNNHTCTIENASGVITSDVNNVNVNCIDQAVNADLTHLPIGDPLILQRINGDESPEVGKLWLCRLPADGAGAASSDDWTNLDGSWNYILKPQVEGQNYFSSEFSVSLDGQGNRIITGNNLPTTPTGTFPVQQGTVAYGYDRNPNFISPHQVQIQFDAIPTVNAEPSCVGFGANGISLTGAAIYQGSSTLGTDASAYEMLDSSGGHTDGTETYHYHFLAESVLAELDPDNGEHSNLMGYIQDGFGIFGPRGEDGEVLSSADLDVCHGHTHDIEWDNEVRNMYHYHWTYDFPYNVGCFRGTPQDLQINNN